MSTERTASPSMATAADTRAAGFYHFTEYISPLRDATEFGEIEDYPIVSNEGWSDAAMRAAKVAGGCGGHLYPDLRRAYV